MSASVTGTSTQAYSIAEKRVMTASFLSALTGPSQGGRVVRCGVVVQAGFGRLASHGVKGVAALLRGLVLVLDDVGEPDPTVPARCRALEGDPTGLQELDQGFRQQQRTGGAQTGAGGAAEQVWFGQRVAENTLENQAGEAEAGADDECRSNARCAPDEDQCSLLAIVELARRPDGIGAKDQAGENRQAQRACQRDEWSCAQI